MLHGNITIVEWYREQKVSLMGSSVTIYKAKKNEKPVIQLYFVCLKTLVHNQNNE